MQSKTNVKQFGPHNNNNNNQMKDERDKLLFSSFGFFFTVIEFFFRIPSLIPPLIFRLSAGLTHAHTAATSRSFFYFSFFLMCHNKSTGKQIERERERESGRANGALFCGCGRSRETTHFILQYQTHHMVCKVRLCKEGD